MRFALPLLSLIALTACDTLYNPSFMPTGYAHHNEVYKSPPASPTHDLSYDYSPYANQTSLTQWRAATDDFVRRLENDGGLEQGIVYIDSASTPSVVQQTFGYALADVLRERGYTIAKPKEQYRTRISYSAHQSDISTNNDALSYASYILKGDIFKNTPTSARISQSYTLPTLVIPETSDSDLMHEPNMMRTRNQY